MVQHTRIQFIAYMCVCVCLCACVSVATTGHVLWCLKLQQNFFFISSEIILIICYGGFVSFCADGETVKSLWHLFRKSTIFKRSRTKPRTIIIIIRICNNVSKKYNIIYWFFVVVFHLFIYFLKQFII